MAANSAEVRKAALAELARRELASRQQSSPSIMEPRTAIELATNPTKGVAEFLAHLGTGMVSTPLNETIAAGAEALPGGRTGDDVMANPPVGTFQPKSNVGQAITGGFNTLMSPVARAIEWAAKPTESSTEFGEHVIKAGLGLLPLGRLGRAPAPKPPQMTSAARVLSDAGVPLDAGQRTGSTALQRARSAVTDHPVTAARQERFAAQQQKAYNRAVLGRVGESGDEATQGVMASAKNRIGSVFDSIGKDGTLFDDALQSEMATIVDRARATALGDQVSPLLKNVDDILSAVDESGLIPGAKLTSIRSNLSALSRQPGIGEAASALEDALLSSLERTYPGQRAVLQEAVTQYRNLKIIENSIAKGTERDISPLALSNTLSQRRNRNMSVYGQGGDQQLVALGQAGRDVLPEVLPNSGTNPRGLMNAPIRALATAPLYYAAQSRLLRQPSSRASLTAQMLRQTGTIPAAAQTDRRAVLAELLAR